jgi:hypothetical protein
MVHRVLTTKVVVYQVRIFIWSNYWFKWFKGVAPAVVALGCE